MSASSATLHGDDGSQTSPPSGVNPQVSEQSAIAEGVSTDIASPNVGESVSPESSAPSNGLSISSPSSSPDTPPVKNVHHMVLAQVFFLIVEMGAKMMWRDSDFVHKEYPCRIGRVTLNLNKFRLVWRTIFVKTSTTLAMAMPFFNEFLALLGAFGFWPLIVFFPIQMHIILPRHRLKPFHSGGVNYSC
ncbi:hypothetical protein K1719_025611 [Acacia pycnantha]|nr:hypothetical protein K1719_025611 [Acacia pycnantha]